MASVTKVVGVRDNSDAASLEAVQQQRGHGGSTGCIADGVDANAGGLESWNGGRRAECRRQVNQVETADTLGLGLWISRWVEERRRGPMALVVQECRQQLLSMVLRACEEAREVVSTSTGSEGLLRGQWYEVGC